MVSNTAGVQTGWAVEDLVRRWERHYPPEAIAGASLERKMHMNPKIMGAVLVALLMCGFASQLAATDAEPKFNSNGDDTAKIRGVLEEFRQDIIRKDGYALTKLVLNPDVLFHHTNTQEEIDSARKYNAQFDGIGPSQLDGFAKLLATSKDKLEERFRDIEIRQDGPLGLVTFTYDFVINDKVHHSGLEVWQVCKIDGQWKILSVAWTIRGAARSLLP
jgi:hypothetical protein